MKKLLLVLFSGLLLGTPICKAMEMAKKKEKVRFASLHEAMSKGRVRFCASDLIDVRGIPLDSLEGLDQICIPENVTLLYIGNNGGITTLPQEILSKFSNLMSLTIENIPITELDLGIFDAMPKLAMLYLRSLPVTSLPDGLLDAVPNLTDLEISGTLLAELPDAFLQRVSQLTSLNLSNNKLLDKLAPDLLRQQRMLVHIDLARNALEGLPDGLFSSARNLSHVGLSNNHLSTLPRSLIESSQLRDVVLTGNPLRMLPEHSIKEFKARHIYTGGHPLFEQEYTLRQLLQDLKKEERLAEVIEVFDDRVYLLLFSRNITSLEGIEDLQQYLPLGSKLVNINLSDNLIKEIPEGAFTAFSDSLEYIILSGNRLTEVPRNLVGGAGAPAILSGLNLDDNAIEYIPWDAFNGYPALNELYLSNNKIDTVDSYVFAQLSQLEILELAGNFLKGLPADLFAENKKLRILDVSDNALQSLPAELPAGLDQLKKVSLKGNQLGRKEQYTFPRGVEVEFYPQSPSRLQTLIAKSGPISQEVLEKLGLK